MKEQDRFVTATSAVNRRHGLVAGMKLAFAAPAVVAALRAPSTAFACGDTTQVRTQSVDCQGASASAGNAKVKHVNLDHDSGTGASFSHTATSEGVRNQTANFDCVLDAKLAKVAHVKTTLDRGGCKIFTSNGQAHRVFVRMKHALRNAEHRVVFCGKDGVNHVLAAFRTNHHGDCRAVLAVQRVVFVPVVDGVAQGRCIVQAKVNGEFVTHFVASRIVWF